MGHVFGSSQWGIGDISDHPKLSKVAKCNLQKRSSLSEKTRGLIWGGLQLWHIYHHTQLCPTWFANHDVIHFSLPGPSDAPTHPGHGFHHVPPRARHAQGPEQHVQERNVLGRSWWAFIKAISNIRALKWAPNRWIHIYNYLSIYLSVCLPACLSVCLPVYLSILSYLILSYLSIYLPIYPSLYLSVCLPACLSVCLSVCLSLCLSVCLILSYLPIYLST